MKTDIRARRRPVADRQQVSVDLGERSYVIDIGGGLLGEVGPRLSALPVGRSAVIITDTVVGPLHGPAVTQSLQASGFTVTSLTVDAGEASKSFAGLQGLVGRMLDLPVVRSSPVIALGGGVVGDLAGFAAAVTLRGLPFIQIPTTLLAQVDSAVGGKTGINASQGKNLIGAFYQPAAVLADTGVLASLPDRQLRAGYAEVVKYGALGDAGFFDWLSENGVGVLALDGAAISLAVAACCTAKARIVAEDEREAGRRALLNLGHTFAHALEAECAYDGRLLHGEAVSIGMALASRLSAELGHCSAADADRLRDHLAGAGLPVEMTQIERFSVDPDRLIAHMRHDKKVQDDALVFILLRRLGEAFVSRDVPIEAVRAVLSG